MDSRKIEVGTIEKSRIERSRELEQNERDSQTIAVKTNEE